MKKQGNIFTNLAIIALVALNIVLVPSVNTVNAGSEKKGDVVAIVNGENITRAQLSDFLIESFKKEGLDILTRRILVEQEAKKQKVTLSKKEIDERIEKLVDLELEKIKSRYGSENKDAFSLDLAKMGYDEKELRAKLGDRLEIDVKPQLLAEKLIKSTISINEDELRAVYEEKYGEKTQVRQIVVKTKEEAEELLRKIRAGADFATIAKDKSIDRPSAAKGGLMNPISKNSNLGKGLASLNKGDLTDVIQSRNGFHIFKIEGKVQPDEKKSYEDALPELEKIVMALNLKKRSGPWFLKLIESADIKNYLE